MGIRVQFGDDPFFNYWFFSKFEYIAAATLSIQSFSIRATEKPFFDKFVRLMVRPSMGLFVRKYRFVPQIVPDTVVSY